MTDWLPDPFTRRGPRYLAIVDAMQDDIVSGKLPAGTRLLPQRDMADRLALSVGTISKAYAEAELRGLIAGQVGRGTYVLRRDESRTGRTATSPAINLALNVPPATGEEELIGTVLAAIAADGGIDGLLGYLPHQGVRAHREAAASWLASHGFDADPDHTFITEGAQHGILLATGLVVAAGDTILTEALTYSGMAALSSWGNYRLRGVELDEHGLIPEALDQAFAKTGAKALFCMPSLQTPTGSTLPLARREAIADIIRKRDAYLFEDDVYAFLFSEPPVPISSLIPERSFYLTSFAKCLAPGLRIGSLVVPPAFRDRCVNGVRVTGWMASPIMAEVVARAIRNGGLANQVRLKRKRAATRNQIVRDGLAGWLTPGPGATPAFHVWLPMPPGRTVGMLIAEAARAGITLAAPNVIEGTSRNYAGVRICLGSPRDEQELAGAVADLRKILISGETMSLV